MDHCGHPEVPVGEVANRENIVWWQCERKGDRVQPVAISVNAVAEIKRSDPT